MRRSNFHIIPFLLMLAFAGFWSSCDFSKGKEKMAKTTVRFKDSNRHYYAIPQGKKQDVIFKYYNTGENPLAVIEVQSSCGCAKVKYPDRLIEPEGEGAIEIAYDSYKNIGYSQVFITVVMNTTPVSLHTLVFDVNIVPEAYYVDDYEKTYEKIQAENPEDEITKMVEGDETEQGYFTDSSMNVQY